ncbi:MAG: hypothetical protein M5U34_21955 [Chloroflexi bacterium]|nr:hypothetical protein [Chloroflexota bacterium]
MTAWLVASNPSQETINKTDTTLRLGLSWLAVGPFLFLELLIFSNLARLTVLTGWGQAAAFFILLTAHLLSVLVLAWLFNRNGGAVHASFRGHIGLAAAGSAYYAPGRLAYWRPCNSSWGS